MPSPTKRSLAGYERQRPFALRYNLRALLYLGVTLLSGGLGILIYQNIGHGVVMANMAGLTATYLDYAA